MGKQIARFVQQRKTMGDERGGGVDAVGPVLDERDLVVDRGIFRENLDIGWPNQVQLIFDRGVTRRTPGRFPARIITEGVTSSLHVDYKRSRIKQCSRRRKSDSE